MEVNCRECAGCCIDWRPIAPAASEHERRGLESPLDDRYNMVPLTRDDIRTMLDVGYGDAMRPRLWTAAGEDRETVEIDDRDIVAMNGRPLYMIGLRQVSKPVTPFGTEPRWLRTCSFLDPQTLQCRIHEQSAYPTTCAAYPGQHLAMDVETECERVEAAFGGDRLVDDDPPEELPPAPFGREALGWTVFAHPEPDRLTGMIERIAADGMTTDDRAEFVGMAAGHSPGTLTINPAAVESATSTVRETTSWVGRAIKAWRRRAGNEESSPADAAIVEETRGAPATSGWTGDASHSC